MVVATLFLALMVSAQDIPADHNGDAPAVDDSERIQLRDGESGRVSMECWVSEEIRVTDCRVRSEIPQNQGFGAAAMQVVTQMIADGRLRPPEDAGPGSRMRFSMPFLLED